MCPISLQFLAIILSLLQTLQYTNQGLQQKIKILKPAIGTYISHTADWIENRRRTVLISKQGSTTRIICVLTIQVLSGPR